MKAVNLIPADGPKGARPAAKLAAGGPVGAYVVLAVLAVAVVMAGAWAFTGKSLSDGEATLARVEAEVQSAEARSAALKPYTEFATTRVARVETVGGLLDGRFDWAHSLREVARVVPGNVDLTSLVGTVSPSTQLANGGGGASLRAALAVPALDLIGCAKTQGEVATLLARLRAIDGVQRVTLASSEKLDDATQSDTECRWTDAMPLFQVTVFYKALDGIVPAVAAATAANTAAPAADTAPAGGAK